MSIDSSHDLDHPKECYDIVTSVDDDSSIEVQAKATTPAGLTLNNSLCKKCFLYSIGCIL